MYRLSILVFDALVPDLATLISEGRSRNVSQNDTARHKIGIALYYMAHGVDGDVLGGAAGLGKTDCTIKLAPSCVGYLLRNIKEIYIGEGILNQPNQFEKVRARFYARTASQ